MFTTRVALDRIGISLTYTSKCGIPLITVLFTVLLDGVSALPNTLALLSLIPIAAGIAAASWNSPTFELLGFSAAAISATAQSALNVTSKRALTKTGLAGAEAQRTMVLVGLLITVVVNVVQVVRHAIYNGNDDDDDVELLGRPPIWLTVAAVTAYHVEYILSFCFVKLVQPVTYGTCDAIRRLTIILSGRCFFGGDKLTRLNMGGIALALLGALAYAITSSIK
jgi:Triose-phosphate Transporter family